jgi:hypothetical protein
MEISHIYALGSVALLLVVIVIVTLNRKAAHQRLSAELLESIQGPAHALSAAGADMAGGEPVFEALSPQGGPAEALTPDEPAVSAVPPGPVVTAAPPGFAPAATSHTPAALSTTDPVANMVASLAEGQGPFSQTELRRLELYRPDRVTAAVAAVEAGLAGKGLDGKRMRLTKIRQYAQALKDGGDLEGAASFSVPSKMAEAQPESHSSPNGSRPSLVKAEKGQTRPTAMPDDSAEPPAAAEETTLEMARPRSEGWPPPDFFENASVDAVVAESLSLSWDDGAGGLSEQPSPLDLTSEASSSEATEATEAVEELAAVEALEAVEVVVPAEAIASIEPIAPAEAVEALPAREEIAEAPREDASPEAGETAVELESDLWERWEADLGEPVEADLSLEAPLAGECDEVLPYEPEPPLAYDRREQESGDTGPVAAEEGPAFETDPGFEAKETSLPAKAAADLVSMGEPQPAEGEGQNSSSSLPAFDLTIATAEDVLALSSQERVDALSFLGPDELERVLGLTDHSELKHAAVDMLEMLGTGESLSILDRLLEAPDPELQLYALDAAERLLERV